MRVQVKAGAYRAWGKRVLDLAASGGAVLALAPVIAILAAAVRWRLGTPILFRQRRPGVHGVPFELLKFRSMTQETSPDGRPLPDAERTTRFGRWLRGWSLDELPTLWNVVRGDMSLVGPRPLLMQYLPLYSRAQARRHEVRPGITGWAQVNGRNAISWEEKFRLDVWYVDHQTLWLDVKVLWMTFVKVMKREGISAKGHATMPVFVGSKGTGADG
ncbi:MAG: sugar transferase [Acidobacteria bacterium]|nr:sugar transferase [Acidobacteriota bacterium]